jgi:hypothetical protein
MNQNKLSQSNLPSNLSQLKQMANIFKGQSNPMAFLQKVSQQYPQVGQVLNMLNSSGMSPKDFFMQSARQMGVDPNEIINLLK